MRWDTVNTFKYKQAHKKQGSCLRTTKLLDGFDWKRKPQDERYPWKMRFVLICWFVLYVFTASNSWRLNHVPLSNDCCRTPGQETLLTSMLRLPVDVVIVFGNGHKKICVEKVAKATASLHLCDLASWWKNSKWRPRSQFPRKGLRMRGMVPIF